MTELREVGIVKMGYHAVYPKDYLDGIDAARNNGFDFAQFDLGVPGFFLDDLSVDALKHIRDYAEDKEIEITFHAPGDNVSLFCDYPLIRQGILDQFKLILDKANLLKARHITVHAGQVPQFKKSGCKINDFYSAYYEDVLYDNMKQLTKSCGDVLICLENYGFNTQRINVAKRLIDEMSPLYLTLDCAKLYTREYTIDQEVYAFMLEYKRSIRELHIHDMNEQFGSHQIVGTGIVDFNLFSQFLTGDVYVNFEVRPVESARISKDKLLRIWNS